MKSSRNDLTTFPITQRLENAKTQSGVVSTLRFFVFYSANVYFCVSAHRFSFIIP